MRAVPLDKLAAMTGGSTRHVIRACHPFVKMSGNYFFPETRTGTTISKPAEFMWLQISGRVDHGAQVILWGLPRRTGVRTLPLPLAVHGLCWHT
jgi:hypothetical protein